MVNPNRFYTYAYLREDRTPYYIGKGQKKRIYDRSGKPCHIPKDNTKIIFLKQNLTEEEAFRHEEYMIGVFGRIDIETGILRNKSNGGQGASGAIRTEETKRKMSEAQKGKIVTEEQRKNIGRARRGKIHSEETRKKLREKRVGKKPALGMKHTDEAKKKISDKTKGENNPFYGKTHNENTKSKLSSRHNKLLKFVSPTGEVVEEFTTITKFCKKYNLHKSNLIKLMKGKSKTCKGWTLYKLEQECIHSPL
jgi:hypothetical protein